MVPLDGSELAAKIFPQVEDLAKTYQAQVTLIIMGHLASAAGALEATLEVIKQASAHEKRISERYLGKTATHPERNGCKGRLGL